MPQVATPHRIFESNDHSLCGIYDDGVHCFPVGSEDRRLPAPRS